MGIAVTQFTRQSSRPLSAESYRAAARKLRKYADALDARCEAVEPRERASLTSCIHGLSHFARSLSARHNRRMIASEE